MALRTKVSTDYRAVFFGFNGAGGGGAGDVTSGEEAGAPQQTPFGQVNRRSVSSVVKIGLIIKPALVGFG